MTSKNKTIEVPAIGNRPNCNLDCWNYEAMKLEHKILIDKHNKLLDELWEMGRGLKTEKEVRDLAQNMLNKIRDFSLKQPKVDQ